MNENEQKDFVVEGVIWCIVWASTEAEAEQKARNLREWQDWDWHDIEEVKEYEEQ